MSTPVPPAAAPRTVRGGLQGRLLVAFVLLAVFPLLLFALAVSALVSRSFEGAAEARLQEALRTVEQQITRERRKAEERVGLVARSDLPAAAVGSQAERTLAHALAQGRDLAALEILDREGHVISSHHWEAGFGLPDRDGTFAGEETLRIEKVAEGYGAGERLALMISEAGRWQGQPVVVRGGAFLDGEFLAELSALMGMEVALRDQARRRWIAAPRSLLSAWADPELSHPPAHPEVRLSNVSFRWAAAPLHPDLWVVVATPRAAVAAVTARVRGLGLGIAGLVLITALAAALVLSRRIARPVRELAEGARRVAAGDLAGAVGAETGGEIGELALAFNRMTEELRASRERLLQAERVAAWREMARRLAHELKNPIFPIQLSIETLRRVSDQEGEDRVSRERFRRLFLESSETILEELRSLRKIIDEFSDFARMPQPELRPTDLNAVVEQAVDLYRVRANGVVIETNLAEPPPVLAADKDLLGRALGNLLGNALDAMPDGGVLRVKTANLPGAVSVEVEDTGPGLTEDQRTRLFTPYYTTKKGGTGLGLSIVQGIVSDHGGRIQVRSEREKGTTFTLVLPTS